MMKKVKKVRAIVCEPNKAPRVEMIEETLESWQNLVDGIIQVIYPHDDDTCIILNDEGKLENLPANRALRDQNGNIYDVIVGTFAIVRAPEDSENFESLTDQQLSKYLKQYADPVDEITAEPYIKPYYEIIPMAF